MEKPLDSEQFEPTEPISASNTKPGGFLGVSTSELAGISVDEIVGNKQAITMVMHYYTQLSDENTSLRNDLNTAKTYVEGYGLKRTDVSVGAGLQFISSLCLAFSVSLLTGKDYPIIPGVLLLIIGVGLHILGLYYSLRTAYK